MSLFWLILRLIAKKTEEMKMIFKLKTQESGGAYKSGILRDLIRRPKITYPESENCIWKAGDFGKKTECLLKMAILKSITNGLRQATEK